MPEVKKLVTLYARALDSFYTSSQTVSHHLKRSVSIVARDTTVAHGVGITSPESIPNTVVFVLFGLIGAGFVCTGIWFFFWAKNGGFHFRQGDWDDYKSTVLRRKGPNGTTLSGATESTDLGGGSIVGKKGRRHNRWKTYKDVDLESSIGTQSEMTEVTATTKKSRWNRNKKAKKEKVDMRGGGDDTNTVISDEPEDVVRAYRSEKPARVGGLNRAPDSSAFDGSTADGSTNADAESALLSHREHTPTNTPSKKKETGGIRHVQTSVKWTSQNNKNRHGDDDERSERIKVEAKKLQEKGRAARRDFSYTQGDDSSTIADDDRRARRERRQSQSPSKKIPGSWNGSEVGSDMTGTKSYHHPIPGLTSSSGNYADERRKARAHGGGYRRGARRDELSDSDDN